MKKYFIFTDIHGFYDLLKAKLDEVGFDINNENHIFVSAGDLFDRGDKPFECLKFVNDLPENRKILVRGNHEDLMEEAIERGYFMMHDQSNGTITTAIRLTKTCDYELCLSRMLNQPQYQTYIKSLVDYAEMGNYIVVHGWVPVKGLKIPRNWRKADWFKARWLNGMQMWRQGYKFKTKTIICGHFHSNWGHYHISKSIPNEWTDDFEAYKPFEAEGIVALDGCVAYSGRMNCKIITVE